MKITLLIVSVLVIATVIVALIDIVKKSAPTLMDRPRRHKGARRHWRAFYLAPLLFDRVAWWFGFVRAPRGGARFANIGEGTHEHGIKSYIPDSGTISRYLLYKIGSTADNCVICGAGDTPLGPSDDQADSNNLDLPIGIKLLGAIHGTTRVITDGTIANGNKLKCGANGQATVANNGDVVIGLAIIPTDAVVVAGDPIEMIPIMPAKHPF